MTATTPNYAMAAYLTRGFMRDKKLSPDQRYKHAMFFLVEGCGLTKVQANKFILSYLADVHRSKYGIV